jgi:hypothetical protein
VAIIACTATVSTSSSIPLYVPPGMVSSANQEASSLTASRLSPPIGTISMSFVFASSSIAPTGQPPTTNAASMSPLASCSDACEKPAFCSL